MIVRSVGMSIEYILKADLKLDEKKQTIFVFRQPTLDERMEQESDDDIQIYGNPENLKTGGQIKTVVKPCNATKKKVALVKACLTDIRNLKDESGKELFWGKKHSKDIILELIFDVISELYDAVLSNATADEELEKN